MNPAKEKQKWFLSKDGPKSPRLDGKGDRKVLDGGAIQVKHESGSSGTARIYIYTTNPKADSTEEQFKVGKDWAQLEAKGYMIGPEDYCDAEVSAYYKITNSDNDDEFTIYWRGGAHPHDDKWPLHLNGVAVERNLARAALGPAMGDRPRLRGEGGWHHEHGCGRTRRGRHRSDLATSRRLDPVPIGFLRAPLPRGDR